MSEYNAIWHLLNCLAGPAKAGPKWVTYSREQVDAMIDVTKQLLEKEDDAKNTLASTLITHLSLVRGKPVEWAEAIEITAAVTNMDETEKQRILAMEGAQ